MASKRVRAIIIDQNRILLIKRVKKDSTYWVFPGGEVEPNETNEQALTRECKEELGVNVRAKDLFLKVDSQKPETRGQKEHFYFCEITGGIIGTGNGPEYEENSKYEGKHIIEWVNISELSKIDLKPAKIKDSISDILSKQKTNLLKNIIGQYDLKDAAKLKFVRESSDNIVYSIGSSNKKILRISKRLPAEDIKFEFDVFEHLSKNNFPIPKWNKTKNGKIFVQNKDNVAVLFDFLDGYKAKVDKDNLPNKNQCHTAGKNLALMHNLGLNFKSDSSRKRNIFSELERAIERKDIFTDQFEGGKEFVEQVKEVVEFAKNDKSTTGLIHNDYRPSNVIFKNDNEISGVIDFDWSCNSPLIKDLALAAVEWSFPDGRTEPSWELFSAFLEGYNSVANNKYEKGSLLYSWIKFATLSDACTYFCDLADDTESAKKIMKSYMYRKYLFFCKYFEN